MSSTFGKLINLHAQEPIVDLDVWRAAQRVRVPRGRKAKSERLLARLGVLRCASCGARMVVASSNHGRYPLYRCPPTGDCERHVSISAEMVEEIVVEAVQAALEGVEGRASAEAKAAGAERELDRAQQELDALIAMLDPLEPAARKRLQAATEARDEARERVARLGGVRTTVTVTAARDWDRLTLAERRALARAIIDRVEVAPGRGPTRVTVRLIGE